MNQMPDNYNIKTRTQGKVMDTPKELSALIKAIKMREQTRGVDLDGATAFTLGYMESYVSMMIWNLPLRHQKKILADMAERTQSILIG